MYLTDFVIQYPPIIWKQREFLTWLAKLHPQADKAIRRVCCREDRISRRYLCNPQIEDLGDFEHRMKFFQQFCENSFQIFYSSSKSIPDDLIHVTCTGYHSPSAPQILISEKKWPTKVIHAYHMGCLAALPAIRLGRGLVALEQKKVDIVHTELCSLHFHPSLCSDEQLVVLSLFGDGLIKYTLQSSCSQPALRIVKQQEQMIPQSKHLMQWKRTSWGLKMTLSKQIPHIVAQAIVCFIEKLVDKKTLSKAYFAIHPGGPKIIESIGKICGLTEYQLAASKKILYNQGNMSSATLPHIWAEMLKSSKYPIGATILGIAFGPGLTISGIVLEKVG